MYGLSFIKRKRKDYLEDQLTAESLKLDDQAIARFILEKNDWKIVIGARLKLQFLK